MKPALSEAGYGSRQWLESEYQRVDGDPWGLDWRPSQLARYRAMLEALDRVLTGRALVPRSVLDIGCATGTFTAMLARHFAGAGAEIRGVDVAAPAVVRARERHPRIGFECLTVDQCAVHFRATMDVVTMLEVLYYVPAHERHVVLQGVARILRPGGVLLVSSMIGRRPYMSATELRELAGTQFQILHSGTLYLRPLTWLEKPMLRLARTRGRPWGRNRRHDPSASRVSPWVAQQLARAARLCLGRYARSHSYVIAVRGLGGDA